MVECMSAVPERMRAAIYEAYGGPQQLRIEEIETPAPKRGDALVRVHAASINDWDWAMLEGAQFLARAMSGLSRPKVRILGCDIAGTVAAVGADVRTLTPGEAVFGDLCESGFGAFAEYVCAPAVSLGRMPDGMGFEQAAAMPQAGMLAVQGLIDIGGIRPGQSVLLNGAGGGVGTFALQIAKLHDVEVTAVDSAGELDMLRELGADRVIDYSEHDFTRGGQRYDLILDPKTDRAPWAYARALNPGGVYATVGGHMELVLAMLALNPFIRGKHLRLVALKPNKDLGYMSDLLSAGKLRAVIDGPYAFEDIAEAFRRFATAEHKGKIVIRMYA
jgi:NADPH:quinone reductase-like Zn-dependent oxidoreductase